ncbi:cytochrome c oxidase assembly protein [Roseovarius tibetensis]|uniref:cytochrome c oxidase assembly protein n=1 Tax=Roseovarius tibetensis TaxID=2685897 RepID=UPI003D7F8E2D
MLTFDPFGPAVSPVFLAGLGVLGWLYLRGHGRPRRLRPQPAPWQDVLFVLGLLLIAGAVNAPLAPSGTRLFSVHQVTHLLMRLGGPLLVCVAQPWGVMYAGLPRGLWRLFARVSVRSVTHALRHPAAATALFIGSLWLWQVPALYALAREMPVLGLLAHAGMTLAGLWYFALLLDPRDPPEGARRGARLLSSFVVIVSNILLGSLTTLKETVLYGPSGSRGTISALSDETMGGYTIWVPSSMIMIAAIILVFNGWNRAEEQRWNARHILMGQSNSAALEFPETAAELRLKVAKPNRDMARTLAFGALAMFAIVMVTAITVLSLGR